MSTFERLTTKLDELHGFPRWQVFESFLAFAAHHLHIEPCASPIVERFGRSSFLAVAVFTEALAIMQRAAREGEWHDWLGALFMQWGLASHWKGQFFTPWHLAHLMARVTMEYVPSQVEERIIAALQHPDNLLGTLVCLLAGMLPMDQGEMELFWLLVIVPTALPFVEPVKLCDMASGSGVMLLAAASVLPHWMVVFGFVTFHGMDIDPLCVRMALVQGCIYGLRGAPAKVTFERKRESLWRKQNRRHIPTRPSISPQTRPRLRGRRSNRNLRR